MEKFNDLSNSNYDPNCKDKNNSNDEESEKDKKAKWYHFEKQKKELKNTIDEKINLFLEKGKTEIETLIESKLPFITANVREEIEQLIDHKLNDLYSFIKKIALLLFVLTIPLTLGVWAIALVIYLK